jgi:parvulin-like peptidyl-prolyl isomerase
MFVNGEYVDDELIRIEAASLREELRAQNPSADDLETGIYAQNLARENLIQRTLLQTAARQDSTPIFVEDIENALEQYYARDSRHAKCMLPRDEQTLRASIELDLRIERLTTRIAAKVARPKPGEIKDYYNQNKRSFWLPELVHAAHIVKNVDETRLESDALASITAIKELLAKGAKFEELADEVSDCPGRGGDLGFFPRGEMVEEFERVVFAMTPGEVSDIFRSSFGFHIVKLYERTPARVRPLNEVRAEIEKLLLEQKRREAVLSYVSDLRSRADIRKSTPANSRQAT